MEEEIKCTLEILRNGGVILYPTDTIWGLGCDATNPEAIERIFRIKERSDSKSMLTLVGDEVQLRQTLGNVSDETLRMASESQEPLTVIYPDVEGLPSQLRGEDGSAGIRVCRYEFTSRLCRELGRPLVSTSANVSGEPSPSTFAEISMRIRESVDYICKTGRDMSAGKPSRIIKIERDGSHTVIR
ncbi:MAG: threonylcarbamoyl-AMP synthase [Muribaculaceae bacterium]|nr:threonylcarbamoyl-AMP synthase [Muribaculaceae bacterium]